MRTIDEIKETWEIFELDANNYHIMKEQFLVDLPKFIGTDTETDGLNPLKSKPFDFVFGWITKEKQKVFVWLEKDAPKALDDYQEILKNECYKHHFAWNAIFDANMMLNIGIDIQDRLADGQALLRLISPSDFSFERKALKKVATKYLAEDASIYEIEVKQYLKTLKATWKKEGATRLEPNYTDIPKELLHRYSPLDVILMMELVKIFYPKVMNSKSPLYQENIFTTECEILPAVIQQVRTGWKVDINYLKNSKEILEKQIKDGREELHNRLGVELNPGQNKELAIWFEKKGWFFPIETRILRNKVVTESMYKVDKELLESIIETWEPLKEKENEVRVCKLIIKLRTFEKWFSTYIVQIEENVINCGDGAFHPSYDPYGSVSGRFTSNSQQFPRGAIYDENGVEIFFPRKLMIPPDGTKLWYFDYSQIELRLGAEWTIIAGLPDPILVGAYLNYDNRENWEPSDMHLEMAKNAFNLTPNEVDSYLKGELGIELTNEETKVYKYTKNCRTLSKIANFASLYGGKRKAINSGCFKNKNLEKSIEIESAFAKTFPGAVHYLKWVAEKIMLYREIKNSLGRLYWFKDSDYSAQKTAGNYVIQGTGADFLKNRMSCIWKFMKDNNLQTKMVGSIHDEIQFAIPFNEEWIVPEIKKIMEDDNGLFVIPIITDIEVSTTNWAEKETYHCEK